MLDLILTPTEARMFKLLEAGRLRTREELFACLVDDMGDVKNIKVHLSSLRRKLQPHGYDVLCNRNGVISYRLVRYTQREE